MRIEPGFQSLAWANEVLVIQCTLWHTTESKQSLQSIDKAASSLDWVAAAHYETVSETRAWAER